MFEKIQQEIKSDSGVKLILHPLRFVMSRNIYESGNNGWSWIRCSITSTNYYPIRFFIQMVVTGQKTDHNSANCPQPSSSFMMGSLLHCCTWRRRRRRSRRRRRRRRKRRRRRRRRSRRSSARQVTVKKDSLSNILLYSRVN